MHDTRLPPCNNIGDGGAWPRFGGLSRRRSLAGWLAGWMACVKSSFSLVAVLMHRLARGSSGIVINSNEYDMFSTFLDAQLRRQHGFWMVRPDSPPRIPGAGWHGRYFI